jgi:hypothetical protein
MTESQAPASRRKTPGEASEFEREQLRFFLSSGDVATTLAALNPSLSWLPILRQMQVVGADDELAGWIERNFEDEQTVRDVVANIHFFGRRQQTYWSTPSTGTTRICRQFFSKAGGSSYGRSKLGTEAYFKTNGSTLRQVSREVNIRRTCWNGLPVCSAPSCELRNASSYMTKPRNMRRNLPTSCRFATRQPMGCPRTMCWTLGRRTQLPKQITTFFLI